MVKVITNKVYGIWATFQDTDCNCITSISNFPRFRFSQNQSDSDQ